MKKWITLVCVSLVFLSACSPTQLKSDKPNVIVTLFPQYDMVRAIAKDKVNLELLLPAGVEPHSYEPTPNTIIRINEADLFIYTSDSMETWISGLLNQLNLEGPLVVNSSIGVMFISHEDEHGHEEDGDEGYDPHFWLDPINMKIMLKNITDNLISIDPDNSDYYQNNADNYAMKLDDLDKEYIDLFNRVQLKTIIYGGHFAFGYLTQRFNVEILSPYTGYSPDAEPSVNAIAQLMDAMSKNNINVIFYEELIDPKIARTISEQTGARIEVLHAAHNLSSDEMKQGLSYFDIMHSNIAKLKEALKYE